MALFGTDGVRGRAGEGVLSAEGTARLAFCFGSTLEVEGGADGGLALIGPVRSGIGEIEDGLPGGLAWRSGWSTV